MVSLLVITGILLTVICLLVKKPVLYAFGASDITYPICGCVYQNLSAGQCICYDKPGDEWIH